MQYNTAFTFFLLDTLVSQTIIIWSNQGPRQLSIPLKCNKLLLKANLYAKHYWVFTSWTEDFLHDGCSDTNAKEIFK